MINKAAAKSQSPDNVMPPQPPYSRDDVFSKENEVNYDDKKALDNEMASLMASMLNETAGKSEKKRSSDKSFDDKSEFKGIGRGGGASLSARLASTQASNSSSVPLQKSGNKTKQHVVDDHHNNNVEECYFNIGDKVLVREK